MKPKRSIIKREQKGTFDVVTLGPPENPPCKKCKKNHRRNGSAYCQTCTNEYFKKVLESQL